MAKKRKKLSDDEVTALHKKYNRKKLTLNTWNMKGDWWHLDCKTCGISTPCSENATSVICSRCVNAMVPWEETLPSSFFQKARYTGPKRPAGWHFMKVFVEQDGTVFHKGVEQPKLKGTLEPTKIVEKKKMSKQEKADFNNDINKQIFKLKKELPKLKLKKDIRATEVLIRKLQRQVK